MDRISKRTVEFAMDILKDTIQAADEAPKTDWGEVLTAVGGVLVAVGKLLKALKGKKGEGDDGGG